VLADGSLPLIGRMRGHSRAPCTADVRARQRPPPRFADIRLTRNRLATSRSLAPASISSAAASRTCSRLARSAAVSPPPSEYLMTTAYCTARQPSAEPVIPRD
jgi:hypothetical protein